MSDNGNRKQIPGFLEESELLNIIQTIEPAALGTPKLKEGERRLVAVLFADVHGFTEMSEKLDPEVVFLIIDELMRVYTKCIKNYGGYIDKYEGDRIMALFGAKETSEQDTERAIKAALQMIDILYPYNRILDEQYPELVDVKLDIRVGINTGLVTTGKIGGDRNGDFTAIGDVVNLASRMESNAPVHRIMLNKRTKIIVDNIFDFDDHGEIRVKGKSKPVSVFLVKRLKAKALRRWEVLKSAHVGRDKVIRILETKFDIVKNRLEQDVNEGERKPVVIGIRGDAGIGKSRLLYEFQKTGNTVALYGTTPNINQNSYCIFAEMIKEYFRISDIDSGDVAINKLEKGMSDLKKYLSLTEQVFLDSAIPMLGYLLNIGYDDIRFSLEPKDLQVHIQTSIRYFIEAVAKTVNGQKEPLIVVLEDLHWIDELSELTIDYLVRTLNSENKHADSSQCRQLMFILTYRPEYEVSKEISSNSAFEEIELQPLQEEDAEKLIQSISGDMKHSQRIRKLLMKKSGGNPFYIEEWVQLVKEMPDTAELPVPDTLNSLILSRIDMLEDNLKQLLQVAAVVGREFSCKVLPGVYKKLNNHDDIITSLKLLEAGDFIIEDSNTDIPSYFFRHILMQEVAYSTMLIANRKMIHRMTAEVIEEQFENLTEFYCELAEHYTKAEIWHKALEYSRKTGTYFKKILKYDDAITYYRKSLSICRTVFGEKHADTASAYNSIGDILESRADCNPAMENYKRAFDIRVELLGENHQDTAQSYDNIGTIYRFRSDYDTALEYHEKSLAIRVKLLGEKHEDTAESYNSIGMIHHEKGDYDSALEFYEKALAVRLELFGELHPDTAHTYNNIGAVHHAQSDYDTALKYFEKSLAIKIELLGEEHPSTTQSYNSIGAVLCAKQDYDTALEYLQKALSIQEKLLGEEHPDTAALYNNIGMIYRLQDDYDRALEHLEKALVSMKKLLGEKHPGTAILKANIAKVYIRQEKYEAAEQFLKKALAAFEELLGERHSHVLKTLDAMLDMYEKMGNGKEADKIRKRIESIENSKSG